MRGEDVVLKFGDREYRARGLKKNTSAELLRVNLRVMGATHMARLPCTWTRWS